MFLSTNGLLVNIPFIQINKAETLPFHKYLLQCDAKNVCFEANWVTHLKCMHEIASGYSEFEFFLSFLVQE